MQKHHIFTKSELDELSNKILLFFGDFISLSNYWYSHSRREIDKFSNTTFNISYFIFKRIINEIFNLTDRTPEQFNQIGKQHRDQALLDKYGSTNAFRFGSVEHKAIIRQKYGVDSVFQNESIKEKCKKTKLEKYGNPYYLNSDKARQTCFERYGKIPNLFGSEEQRLRMQELYGVTSYAQTLEYHLKCHHRYKYNDCYFDSFPELCFYIYHIKNNINIIRCPLKLEYYHNNKIHYYIPDFKVNDQLVELKGPHLLKEDGSFKPIFGEREPGLTEAKYNCAVAHKVKIISEAEYKKYIDWFYTNLYNKEDYIV